MFSGSGSGKKPQQQLQAKEMVQVGSPFWKAPNQRETTPKRTSRESGIVVGAAYSHADILRLDQLSSLQYEEEKKKIALGQSAIDDSPGATLSPRLDGSFGAFHSRRYSNSADIAIERPAPSYPLPKKSEGKILRPQYKEILRDPANALHLINYPSIPANATPKEAEAINSKISRIDKFKKLLQATSISLPELRKLAWSGVPEEVRAMTWQLLLSYLPTNSERRVATLERKRKEYLDGVRQAFDRAGVGAQSAANPGKARGLDEAIWHQISIDVPRTNPHLELYGYEATQRSLERILYVWAVRHPASGYVQGINDLVTPFWQVFLSVYIADPNIETGMDPGQLPRAVLDAVEADSFWCLTKLLDGIQDHYIVAQPGIQRQAEEQGFSEFHLYVCAAFLVKWSDKLVKMDFQEIMMFLQSLPTKDWGEKDIEMLLSEAYIWQSLFKGSSAHLKGSTTGRSPLGNLQL
ncbi:unnamed protein product [Parascedosporium putredinis]|uniref:Rab-GAP TBC domain-containing protein n=1 Tax=Parascedosporium putredinis TaxID=1442378 RepID=A0A9P1M793_9PEZI|nr:unnamed protein product [Parascedosporium putredinis]CAI7990028.1 unnamed protein product [Parascedosporium putredinis]